jgi:hypothetical protein
MVHDRTLATEWQDSPRHVQSFIGEGAVWPRTQKFDRTLALARPARPVTCWEAAASRNRTRRARVRWWMTYGDVSSAVAHVVAKHWPDVGASGRVFGALERLWKWLDAESLCVRWRKQRVWSSLNSTSDRETTVEIRRLWFKALTRGSDLATRRWGGCVRSNWPACLVVPWKAAVTA